MTKLFVFAGQSNMAVFGTSELNLPSHLAAFDYGKTYIWGGSYWGALVPGVNTGTQNLPAAWGPETEFAYRFRQQFPDEVLLIVKMAKGETPLDATIGMDWSPYSDNEMFDLTAQAIIAARASGKGGWPAPSAVFWMQGESDGFNLEAAQQYKANLVDLIYAVRNYWELGDNPFILGNIHDHEAIPYNQLVRTAQWEVAQEMAAVERFPTKNFTHLSDNIHLAPEGVVQLGDAFFTSWIT